MHAGHAFCLSRVHEPRTRACSQLERPSLIWAPGTCSALFRLNNNSDIAQLKKGRDGEVGVQNGAVALALMYNMAHIDYSVYARNGSLE